MAHIQKLGMMNMVTEERGKLTQIAKELMELLDSIQKDYKSDNPTYTEIRKKILDLLKHLTNIVGYCDEKSQDRIRQLAGVVTTSIQEVRYDSLRKICVLAIGLQVDFNKFPFMMSEFDVKALDDEFKSMFNR